MGKKRKVETWPERRKKIGGQKLTEIERKNRRKKEGRKIEWTYVLRILLKGPH
jgi:hypothetical protein